VIRVATYNIHAGVGADGRRDLGRIAAVIEEIGPDVIGLQEVDSRPSRGGLDQAEQLAARLAMACVEGPILREEKGWYGNAILSRHPIAPVARLRFDDHSGEPRGAVVADVQAADHRWLIGNTHLDLRAGPRLHQARELVQAIADCADGRPGVLLGDFNEWRPWAPTLGALRGLGDMPPAPATYPSRLPLLLLDRMVLRDCRPQVRLHRHAGDLARRASDHLPIYGDLTPAGPTPRRRY
jgi:endonuclease/exonuclease/phosphatase family metal-dependent hydrolase